jgi:tetratricopeptide (TPR) repeat protein
MFANLQLFGWSAQPGASSPSSAEKWTLDRNWDRAEGERLLKAKNYASAETLLIRAISEAEARKRSAPKRIYLHLQLAEAQRQQFRAIEDEPNVGKLIAAEQTVRAALEIAAKSSESALYVQCLDALDEIFTDQGRFDAVEKVMQEAIRIESALPHPDPLRMARRTVRMGIARHRMGRTKDAIPILEKAVAMHEESFGPEHAETGRQLTELGAAYRAEGRHEEAQKCLRRALRIHQREQGIDSPGSIASLHHLAGSLEDAGDPEGAAQQYETALTYKLRTIGSNLDDLAEMQFGLANLHINWQHYSRARELLYEASGTFRRKGGVRLAVTYETLAHVEECSGRYTDAVKELALAGKVWEGMRPERTPELIRNMERRAELLDQLRKKGESSYLREKIATLQQQLDQEAAERQAAMPPPIEIESLPQSVPEPAKPEPVHLESAKDQPELLRLSLPVAMTDAPFPKTT